MRNFIALAAVLAFAVWWGQQPPTTTSGGPQTTAAEADPSPPKTHGYWVALSDPYKPAAVGDTAKVGPRFRKARVCGAYRNGRCESKPVEALFDCSGHYAELPHGDPIDGPSVGMLLGHLEPIPPGTPMENVSDIVCSIR
jgi:hypothetical protein